MSKSGYSVYMGKCLLPVSPQKINVRTDGGNRTVSLIDGNEVSVLGSARLSNIELSFIIPQVRYPFAVYTDGFKGANFFIDYFKQLNESKNPFQFIVIRCMPDGRPLFSENIKVSMESLDIYEQASEGFDLEVRARLKQYRCGGPKTLTTRLGSGISGLVSDSRSPSTTQDKPILIGSEVIVNGRLHGSSYGDAPGQMRNNYRGKVNFINLKGSHPYHIATMDGGWLGWVTKDSVKAV